MAKEKLDEVLAGPKALLEQQKAQLAIAELNTQVAQLTVDIEQLCTAKTLDYTAITKKLDELALTERKAKQLTDIIAQLFPTA